MPDDIPDVYADQFQMNQSAYGLTLVFGAVPSTAGGPGPVIMEKRAVVRMSLEHAKILAMVLRKNLKQYELEHLGESIPLPRNVLQPMNLSLDDW
jgi:hypothetical protein